MERTYHGSCHCKAITFTATFDPSDGTGKCNCRLCWKQRMWKTNKISSDKLLLISESDALGAFRSAHGGTHHFCNRCGISTHTHIVRPQTGEDYVMIQVATFDDLPIEELLAAPLRIVDGYHDKWTSTPEEIGQL
jgi:hypothetical protein